MLEYIPGTYFLPQVCTRYILCFWSMNWCVPCTNSKKKVLNLVHTWGKKYVPGTYFLVHTSDIFSYIWYSNDLISEGYICEHTDFVWVHNFSFWFFCALPGPAGFAWNLLQAIHSQAPAHTLNQITLKQFYCYVLAMRLMRYRYTFIEQSLHACSAADALRAPLRAEVWTGALALLVVCGSWGNSRCSA